LLTYFIRWTPPSPYDLQDNDRTRAFPQVNTFEINTNLKKSSFSISVDHNSIKINPLKMEFLPNNIYKSSSYHTGNTLRLHYKAQPVNAV
jgi:hypothetical protein